MATTRRKANELARLQRVQTRVRTLAREHGWLADAIRAAFNAYLDLIDHFVSEESAMRDRECKSTRELLTKGRLIDPKTRDNSPCQFVRVRGLCSVALARRLANHGHGQAMPSKLEREGAAAALAALDRDVTYQDRALPEKMREEMAAEYRTAVAAKTHVSFVWTIVISRPADWQEPPDPRSLEHTDLERFEEGDYRTIALHRLGGLADVGAIRPVVPKPKDTGDWVRDFRKAEAWVARFPIEDTGGDPVQSSLSVMAFPPDVAEQMLQEVEAWVKKDLAEKSATMDASKTGGGNSAAGKLMSTVVLWEGAEHSGRNIRLAHTRSAYLEAHGNVCAALKALERDGHAIGKSTFYDHLKALDTECRGWRDHLLVSGASGIPENGVIVRKPRNSRGNSR